MPITDYTPSVEEVARLIPSRAAGRFVGGGDADTPPSFPDTARVEAVIDDAVGLIAPTLGGDALDERFYAGAKALVKLQTALILEPSAWPEQARPDKSAFEQWMQLLDTRLEGLTKAIILFRDDGGDSPGESQPVTGGFPRPGLSNGTPLSGGPEPQFAGFPYGDVEW